MDKKWKRFEREIGKLLWEYDEPSDFHKPRTGDVKGFGGDAESRRWVAECKKTDKETFRITRDILEKIRNRAKERGKLPVLAVGLPYKTLFVLDRDTFVELIEVYRDFNNLDFEEKLGNKELRYELKRLKESVRRVLKLLGGE